MAEEIASQLERDVAYITLPGSGIANSDLDALADALDGVGELGCAAVVLRGEGDDFCRGRSLRPGAERPGPDGPWGIENRNAGPVLRMFAALGGVPVPVVAVVKGKAWGLGCALAAACDITVATAGATFCLPEMRRSIPPTLALSVLRSVVSYKALIHLVLTSSILSAEEARALGLVTTVAGKEGLDDALGRVLGHLRSSHRISVMAVKRYLRSAARMEAAAAGDFASAVLAGALASGSLQ